MKSLFVLICLILSLSSVCQTYKFTKEASGFSIKENNVTIFNASGSFGANAISTDTKVFRVTLKVGSTGSNLPDFDRYFNTAKQPIYINNIDVSSLDASVICNRLRDSVFTIDKPLSVNSADSLAHQAPGYYATASQQSANTTNIASNTSAISSLPATYFPLTGGTITGTTNTGYVGFHPQTTAMTPPTDGFKLYDSAGFTMLRSDGYRRIISFQDINANAKINIPTSITQDTAVTITAPQTLTNKTINGTSNSITNIATSSISNLEEAGSAKMANVYNEFMNSTNTNDLIQVISGTGTSIGTMNSTATHPGIINGNLGTTTTGRAGMVSPLSTIVLGGGIVTFSSVFAFTNLSDATNTYVNRLGFLDTYAGESANAVFFRYTHSVNSGKIEAVTRNGNSETATDTGVTPVAGTWYNMMIVIINTSSALFYVDGVLKATITTNIPTTAFLGYGVMAIRSAGTASFVAWQADFIKVKYVFTTPR